MGVMRIKLLPDTVINQIAAGEVVERAASVVRELVDNAVDAGATDIFVALEGGGHSRLKVRDNGCGMSRDEAILAFERHATSKVSSVDDLCSLSTLGFRGEALASIAAVSKIQLKTRSRDSDLGTHVVMRGGKLVDVRGVAWNEGTEIEVEHLFFNTPARRKFLKSPRAEVARIRTWLAHSGLARPEIRYRLVSDGDEILNLRPVTSLIDRARDIFTGDLFRVELVEGEFAVEGMVSHPGQAISDASGLVILVNGRLVSDKIIQRAVREGYDSMLKDREYPTGYISLSMPAQDVDVNVHPQKSEVRFRHPQQIFAVVQGAVLAAVRGIRRPMFEVAPAADVASAVSNHSPKASSVSVEPQTLFGSSYNPSAPVSSYSERHPLGVSELSDGVDTYHREPHSPVSAGDLGVRSNGDLSSAASAFRFSDLRYIGQALECYLLCDLDGRLVVVDMHAAHERVNYNKIRRARAERAITTQRSLIPDVVRLTDEQVVTLMEQVELLRELGFDISQVGSDSVAINGVPGVVAHLNCVALIKECAAEPVSAGWRERFEERIDHISARLACHASVRSGDLLNRTEVYALFSQLDEAELSGACPHGRPVVAEFSRAAVERWFGRDR
jgi:DNA mismatch repair protein MutL